MEGVYASGVEVMSGNVIATIIWAAVLCCVAALIVWPGTLLPMLVTVGIVALWVLIRSLVYMGTER